MRWTSPLAELGDDHRATHGGKACALAELLRMGLPVPPGIAVSVEAYQALVRSTALDETIALELGRKRFEDMRWEELWDASLRIRNRFARVAWPEPLRRQLRDELAEALGEGPWVVRSSAPAEDSSQRSFAGLHDSYVNVRSVADVLEHIRHVWASLWSDRALLYRQELGLDPRTSAMAVVVQDLAVGERSGVCFTRSPVHADEAMVEAVWGLNEGLVDGTVAPDRWHLARGSGALRHEAPEQRDVAVRARDVGTRGEPLPDQERNRPPLSDPEVRCVYDLAHRIEQHRDAPQDVEFTLCNDRPLLLQARPITTGGPTDEADDRAWYLTLHRSFDQLVELRRRIEDEVLPGMAAEADTLAHVALDCLSAEGLAEEIRRRMTARDHWVAAYWQDCIPFAHGIRLFGEVCNQRLRPQDPFAFVELLREGDLLAVQRNHRLEQLAQRWLEAGLPTDAAQSSGNLPEPLREEMDRFLLEFGTGLGGAQGVQVDRRTLATLLQGWSAKAESPGPDAGTAVRLTEAQFFGDTTGDERAFLESLLDLGRASYRLRDDDNLFLGRVDAELQRALRAGRALLGDDPRAPTTVKDAPALLQRLEDPASVVPVEDVSEPPLPEAVAFQARQLLGQPASPGFARGLARVIQSPDELFAVRRGEVLVVDALNPNMTFVAPLCAAIVERRGGMLIHGAIIAREYGVPAVTGVPEATRWIRTGDQLVVDGHLGLVTVTHPGPNAG